LKQISNLEKTVIYVFLSLISLWIFIPVGWTLITSIKESEEIFSSPITYFPKKPTLKNYTLLFIELPFGRQIFNSLFVSSISAAIAVVISTLASYSFSRFVFRGRKNLLSSILIFSMLPAVLFMIPYFSIMSMWGLINTYWALIITYSVGALPFSMWMLVSYFNAVPKDIDESAMIDGCSRLQVIYRIILPLAAPGIFATYIYAFIGAWDEFILASILTSSDEMRTATVGIYSFIGQHTTEWGPMCAATLVFMVPVIVLFSYIQKHLIRGLTAGALKS